MHTTNVKESVFNGSSSHTMTEQARNFATQPAQANHREASSTNDGSHSQGDSVVVNEIDLISPRGVAADITYKMPSSQLEVLAKTSAAGEIQGLNTATINDQSRNIGRGFDLGDRNVLGGERGGVFSPSANDESKLLLATQIYPVGALQVKHLSSQNDGDVGSMGLNAPPPKNIITQADISEIPVVRSDTSFDEMVLQRSTPASQGSELYTVVDKGNNSLAVANSDDALTTSERPPFSPSRGKYERMGGSERRGTDSAIVVSFTEDDKTSPNSESSSPNQGFHAGGSEVGPEHVKNSLSNHSTTQQDGQNDTASRQVLTINGPATVKSADSAPATHEISGNNVSKKWVFRLQNGETLEQSNKTTEIMSTAGLLGPCSQNDHPNVHNSTSSSGKTVTDITKVGTGGTFPSSLPEKLPQADSNDPEKSNDLKPQVSPYVVSTPKDQMLTVRSFGSRGSLSQPARVSINPLKEIPKPWFPFTVGSHYQQPTKETSRSSLPQKRPRSSKEVARSSVEETCTEVSGNSNSASVLPTVGENSKKDGLPASNESQESQKIVLNRRALKKGRRNIKSDTSEGEADNDSSQPEKGNPRTAFPIGVRSVDNEYLSKKDIAFQRAVWYQYDTDFNYYPGLLLSDPDYDSDTSLVKFYTGVSVCKNDDLYYLDIRIGDVVSFEAQKYVVVGLECRTKGDGVIRCIRGYDTLYLQKKIRSPDSVDPAIVLPLVSIKIALEDWVKRPKIVSGDECSNLKNEAYETLRHPIRYRRNGGLLSPRRARTEINYAELTDDDMDELDPSNTTKVIRTFERGQKRVDRPYTKYTKVQRQNQLYRKNLLSPAKFDSDAASLGEHFTTHLESETQNRKLSPQISPPKSAGEAKIFSKCLFVITGTFGCRDEIQELIRTAGGTVLESGFSEALCFDDDASMLNSKLKIINLKLKWKHTNSFSGYRFACLISSHHLRSLKYLETLALGWPILHWKFVYDTLRRGKFSYDILPRYLLAAGESLRLKSSKDSDVMPIFKSHNIFQFYGNLINGSPLSDQIGISSDIMKDFVAILYKTSGLTSFVGFTLACFGVNRLYCIDSKCTNSEIIKNLSDILNDCSKQRHRLLLYSNSTSDGTFDKLLESIQEEFSENGDFVGVDYHVGSKEWLVQTIISGDTGFDD